MGIKLYRYFAVIVVGFFFPVGGMHNPESPLFIPSESSCTKFGHEIYKKLEEDLNSLIQKKSTLPYADFLSRYQLLQSYQIVVEQALVINQKYDQLSTTKYYYKGVSTKIWEDFLLNLKSDTKLHIDSENDLKKLNCYIAIPIFSALTEKRRKLHNEVAFAEFLNPKKPNK